MGPQPLPCADRCLGRGMKSRTAVQTPAPPPCAGAVASTAPAAARARAAGWASAGGIADSPQDRPGTGDRSPPRAGKRAGRQDRHGGPAGVRPAAAGDSVGTRHAAGLAASGSGTRAVRRSISRSGDRSDAKKMTNLRQHHQRQDGGVMDARPARHAVRRGRHHPHPGAPQRRTRRLSKRRARRLTLTAFALKAVVAALKKHPHVQCQPR